MISSFIVYIDKIVKYMYTIESQTGFANDIGYYTYDYRNVYHDEYRNLYVVARNHILKYVDKLSIVSLVQDTEGMTWALEDLYVDKNEYIQDWVVNRSLNRMWDNIEIFQKSILGKFDYMTIQNITTATVLSTIPIPDNFDFCSSDWLYTNGKYITVETIFETEKPVVRTFTVDEYKELPYTKDDVFVGINELVSAPVINRPISKLLACQETIREMLS